MTEAWDPPEPLPGWPSYQGTPRTAPTGGVAPAEGVAPDGGVAPAEGVAPAGGVGAPTTAGGAGRGQRSVRSPVLVGLGVLICAAIAAMAFVLTTSPSATVGPTLPTSFILPTSPTTGPRTAPTTTGPPPPPTFSHRVFVSLLNASDLPPIFQAVRSAAVTGARARPSSPCAVIYAATVATGRSPQFIETGPGSNFEIVSSQLDFFSRVAVGRAALSHVLGSSYNSSCLSQFAHELGTSYGGHLCNGGHATTTGVLSTVASAVVEGRSGAVLREQATVSCASRASFHVADDIYLVLIGRAIVEAEWTNTRGPVPAAVERALAGTLVFRASLNGL